MIESEVKKIIADHNHAPDPVNVEVRQVVNDIRDSANKSNDSTSKVITETLGTISDEAAAQLPSSSSLTRIVQNVRQNNIQDFPVSMEIEGFIVPDLYKVTNKNKPFLLHDSNDGRNRFLLFSTNKNLPFFEEMQDMVFRRNT